MSSSVLVTNCHNNAEQFTPKQLSSMTVTQDLLGVCGPWGWSRWSGPALCGRVAEDWLLQGGLR